MHLKKLPLRGPWTIYAACKPSGRCPLEEFFASLGANMRGSATGMYALLADIAQRGLPQADSIAHQIDGDIWELRKGRLRVLYFVGSGKVIICSHGFVKRTQKTPAAEINKAQSTYAAYRRAVQHDALEFMEE